MDIFQLVKQLSVLVGALGRMLIIIYNNCIKDGGTKLCAKYSIGFKIRVIA